MLLLLGVGGLPSCCALDDSYLREAARDEEVWRTEPPLTAERHAVGTLIDLGALSEMLSRPDCIEALPVFTRDFSLAALGLELPAKLQLKGRLLSLKLAATPTCDGCVRVEAEVELNLRAEVPAIARLALSLPADGWKLPAKLTLSSRLMLRPAEDRTVLLLDLSRATSEAFEVALNLLPPRWASPIRERVLPLAQAAAAALLSEVEVLEVKPWQAGQSGLRFAPVALHTDDRHNQLYLGMTTNLALPEGDGIRPWFEALGDATVRTRIAGGFPEAVLRAMLARKIVPRNASDSNPPDARGAPRVTLNRLRLQEDRIQASFRLWFLRWPCLFADVVVTGRIARNPRGIFEARLEGLGVEHASALEEKVRRKVWSKTEKLKAVASRSIVVLNQRFFELTRLRLRWQPLAYRVTTAHLEIDAQLVVAGPGEREIDFHDLPNPTSAPTTESSRLSGPR